MTQEDKLLKQQLRKKYGTEGFDSLSDREMLTLLLTYSSNGNFSAIAEKLEERFSSLIPLINADSDEVTRICSSDNKTAVLLRLIAQLSRIYFMENSNITSLRSPTEAREYFESYFIGASEEKLTAVCTDDKFRIINHKVIFTGSVSAVKASCRDIADFAVKNNSSRIFIAHNHPNGAASPSPSDFTATDIVSQTLEQLGITLIDHIIVGKNSSVSMQELPLVLPFKKADCFGYNK